MSDAESLLDAAVAHHRDGRLDEAASLYEQALAREPDNLRAAHNLGSIWLTRNAPAKALPLLRQAYEGDPASDRIWVSYGRGLIAAGDFAAAEALLSTRSGPEAPAFAVRLRRSWAAALAERGAVAEAEQQLAAAQAIAPGDPDLLGHMGRLAFAQGHFPGAAARFARAVAAAPDRADLHVNLGAAQRLANDLAAARASFETALRLDPANLTALRNLGLVLLALDQAQAALDLAEAWLARAASPEAAMARGVALRRLGRVAEAVQVFESLIDGDLAFDAWNKLAAAYQEQGRGADALAAIDRALALQPDAADARFQRGTLRLSAGDFAGGWRDYAARWRSESFLQTSAKNAPAALRARWALDAQAEDLSGRTVLITPEQGVGDEIMFASIVPEVAAGAASVTLVCEPRLKRLFAASFPQVAVRSLTEPVAPETFEIALPIGELGRLFRQGLQDFPARPYLSPTADARAKARSWLGDRMRPRVGVSWRGGPPATRHLRSMPLEGLAPLLTNPAFDVVSLQYGDVEAEVAAANGALGCAIRTPPPALIDDFDDLAGVVAELDLVVSVQTALVHLCGAIGQTCHALIPHVAEWRYMQAGDRTPWYGSVRLWRQGEDRAWDPIAARVAQTVQQELAPP